MKRILINSEEETTALAQHFASTLKGGEIVLMTGDLGAGKSFFVRALANSVGVKKRINSPTFVLMKVYNVEKQIFKKIVHVDAYRVETDDLLNVGLDEYLDDPEAVIFIEWGEKIEDFLTKNDYIFQKIDISITGLSSRVISI